jgi:fibro-slime domain-containing protein
MHFRVTYIFVLLLIVLVGFEFISLVVYRPDTYGLEGKYFNNTEWQGEPAITALDSDISHETLKIQGEKLPQNRYSVEWTGYIDMLETAAYTFFLESDDGSWLFINDKLVVDNGGMHGLVQKEGKTRLRKGVHPIKIRYFQAGGYAVLRLFWKREEEEKKPLSNVYLFPPNTNRLYRLAKNHFPFIVVLSGIFIIFAGDSIVCRDEHKKLQERR